MDTTNEPDPQSHFDQATNIVVTIRAEVTKVFIGQQAILGQVLRRIPRRRACADRGQARPRQNAPRARARADIRRRIPRIQFTPDLMPSDVTGHTLYDMGAQQVRLRRGPVSTNLLLADASPNSRASAPSRTSSRASRSSPPRRSCPR